MGRRAGSEAHRDIEFVIPRDLAGTTSRDTYIHIGRNIEIWADLQFHSTIERWITNRWALIVLRRAAEPEEGGNKKGTSQKSQKLPRDLPVAIWLSHGSKHFLRLEDLLLWL